jgi:hypothetical protein
MYRLSALFTCSALLLAGCASSAYKAKMPDLAGSCVSGLEQLKQLPLTYPAPANDKKGAEYVEFADAAQCYRATSKAPLPVVLYRLDGIVPPSQLDVSLVLSTGGTFAADVDLLDANFHKVKGYGFDQFTRRGTQYSLSIFLNSEEKEAKYLMLTPDSAEVGKNDTSVEAVRRNAMIPITTGAVTGYSYYATGTEKTAVRPLLAGGKFLIVAKPAQTTSQQ